MKCFEKLKNLKFLTINRCINKHTLCFNIFQFLGTLAVIILLNPVDSYGAEYLNSSKKKTNAEKKEAELKSIALDQELFESLKKEAHHNLNRLKSLKQEKQNIKIFDDEREKGLALFFEEQEKFDAQRERGLKEFRKERNSHPSKEGSPAHQDFINTQKQAEVKKEESRKVHIATRNQVMNESPGLIAELESSEMNLLSLRPRYDQRQRGRNKWLKNQNKSNGSGGGTSGSAPFNNDFNSTGGFPAPSMDYTPPPPPPPADFYEEMPPPPPPAYDGGMGGFGNGFDQGGFNGEAMPSYPPQPQAPPQDWDF